MGWGKMQGWKAVQRNPVTEILGLAFLWAAEQSLLCEELMMPWGSQERGILGANSPAAVDGSFPVLGSGMELNPWTRWYPSKQPWFVGGRSGPCHPGTHIVQSWLRADPALLQEGIIQGSSAWDSTTQLLPRKERRFILPFLVAGTVKSAVTDPCRS